MPEQAQAQAWSWKDPRLRYHSGAWVKPPLALAAATVSVTGVQMMSQAVQVRRLAPEEDMDYCSARRVHVEELGSALVAVDKVEPAERLTFQR